MPSVDINVDYTFIYLFFKENKWPFSVIVKVPALMLWFIRPFAVKSLLILIK